MCLFLWRIKRGKKKLLFIFRSSGRNWNKIQKDRNSFSITWKQKLEQLSVQFSSPVVSDSLRPQESQHARPPCPSPSPRVHSDSTSTESVMPSSHLILGRPLLLLPPIPPSIRVFSNESTLRMRWPKYLNLDPVFFTQNRWYIGRKLIYDNLLLRGSLSPKKRLYFFS